MKVRRGEQTYGCCLIVVSCIWWHCLVVAVAICVGQHSRECRSGEAVTFAGGIDSTCCTMSMSEAGGYSSPQCVNWSIVCGLRRFEI